MAYLLVGPISLAHAGQLQRVLHANGAPTDLLRDDNPALQHLLAELQPAPKTAQTSLLEHFADHPRLLAALRRAKIPVEIWNLQDFVDWLASYDNQDGGRMRGRRVPENIRGIGPNLGPILRAVIKTSAGISYPPERHHDRGYLHYRPTRPARR